MSVATHLNIEITRKCNQNCFYCFNDSGQFSNTEEIPLEHWKQILFAMKQEGLKSIHVTGGEPFIWSDTINLLGYAQGIGLDTSILSNGLRIVALAKNYREVLGKLRVAQISLDAMNPELHDRRRGFEGAWQHAMSAIKTLDSLQVPVEISAVVSDENIDELEAVGKYAQSIRARLIVRPLVSAGRGSHTQVSQLFPKRLARVLKHLKMLNLEIVSDRFQYVPVADDIDAQNSNSGILTVAPDGKLRGGSFSVFRQVAICNVLELLKAA
ncbi:MAG: radical SAM protein [Stigonema ocellatum SAG 48.90 = DSM 106950]|nr:radical SAM protein [Stigonema ocellatum SAG 48.90 = DSM 106950]